MLKEEIGGKEEKTCRAWKEMPQGKGGNADGPVPNHTGIRKKEVSKKKDLGFFLNSSARRENEAGTGYPQTGRQLLRLVLEAFETRQKASGLKDSW